MTRRFGTEEQRDDEQADVEDADEEEQVLIGLGERLIDERVG